MTKCFFQYTEPVFSNFSNIRELFPLLSCTETYVKSWYNPFFFFCKIGTFNYRSSKTAKKKSFIGDDFLDLK